MNNIEIFKNQEFGELRTILKDGEPWFLATDVCRVLEHTNATVALARLDEDEKAKLNLGLQGGATNIVSESGLYTLALGSRKPQARPFKRWVTHDVIPSIRNHGMYATPETAEKILNDPDFLIQALTDLKHEREQRLAEQALREKAEAKIEADKPKVLFANCVASSRQSILIREMSKLLSQNGIDIGEKRLFSWLRSNGYLISKQGEDYNLPTQYSMSLKLMIIRERTYTDDINTRILRTPMITGKGQQYFINKFIAEGKRYVQM